jgi:hypothetical protein
VGFFIYDNIYNKNQKKMDKKILNEIENIKYLLNYNRTKTLNEQSETPVPTPTPTPNGFSGSTQTTTGSTQTPVPTPTPTPIIGGSEASSVSRIELGGPGDPYQYKYEDDGTTQKYYYAKKGQNNWKQSMSPQSVEAIKKNIFKIN